MVEDYGQPRKCKDLTQPRLPLNPISNKSRQSQCLDLALVDHLVSLHHDDEQELRHDVPGGFRF